MDSPRDRGANDNGGDPVEVLVAEFHRRSAGILRDLVRERFPFAAPVRLRRAVTRATSADLDAEPVDDVTRARARELLTRHTGRRGAR